MAAKRTRAHCVNTVMCIHDNIVSHRFDDADC